MTDEPRDDRAPDAPAIEGMERLRVPPPPDLEDAVVDALADRGWLERPGRRPAVAAREPRRGAWRPWAMAAAVAGAFALGALVARQGSGPGSAPGSGPGAGPAAGPTAAGPTAAAGPRFVLLLYEGPGVARPATDAEHAAIVQAYVAWSDSVRGAGYDLIGEELADRGGALSGGPGGIDVETGRFAPADTVGGPRPPGPVEGPDVLAGFHLLTAPDLDTALDLARSHPHLARGGRIVVRPIVEH